jgi:hypothetical protein
LNKANEAQRKEQEQQGIDDKVSDKKTATNKDKNISSYLYPRRLTSSFLKERLQLR